MGCFHHRLLAYDRTEQHAVEMFCCPDSNGQTYYRANGFTNLNGACFLVLSRTDMPFPTDRTERNAVETVH